MFYNQFPFYTKSEEERSLAKEGKEEGVKNDVTYYLSFRSRMEILNPKSEKGKGKKGGGGGEKKTNTLFGKASRKGGKKEEEGHFSRQSHVH